MPLMLAKWASSRRQKHAPSLPMEIWFHIASFIPFVDFTSSHLYALNRHLLTYYLDKKYAEIVLSYEYDKRTLAPSSTLIRLVNHLMTSPAITSTARSLTINFVENNVPIDLYHERLSHKHWTPPDNNSSTLQALTFWKRKDELPTLEEQAHFPSITQLTSAFSQLTNLTSIKISLEINADRRINHSFLMFHEIIPEAISRSWTSSHSTLKALHLSFNMRDLGRLSLSFHDVHLPNLNDFQIRILPLEETLIPVDTANKKLFNCLQYLKPPLVQFLTRHQSQITCLAFGFPPTGFTRQLLLETPHLPSLIDLQIEFHVDPGSMILEPLTTFLKKHAGQLQRFTPLLTYWIDYVRDEGKRYHADVLYYRASMEPPRWEDVEKEYLRKGLLNLEFPKLKVLNAEYKGPASLVVENVARVVRSAGSITEISITRSLTLEHLRTLFKTLRHAKHLHTIRLGTSSALTPSLLYVLTVGLPFIRELHLVHSGIAHDDSTIVTPTLILEEFATRTAPRWTLERMYIRNEQENKCNFREQFRQTLVEVLPGVKRINGMTPKEYVLENHR